MKNFIFPITIAFLISLLIHFLFFDGLNKTLHKDKLNMNTSTKKAKGKKGFTSIKYVKLRKPEPKIEPKKPTPKVVKKVKKILKPKKAVKKTPLIKKVRTIKLPKAQPQNTLKNLFTISKKEKAEEEKRKEALKKEITELQKLDPQTQQYIKLYGDQYFTLSKEQRRYLKQNLNSIGRITQRYLTYPSLSARTGQYGVNVVEFTLHPNGDITDLRITDGSGYTMLDRNTIETIELAYKDYPKPKQPTKIKINVKYILY